MVDGFPDDTDTSETLSSDIGPPPPVSRRSLPVPMPVSSSGSSRRTYSSSLSALNRPDIVTPGEWSNRFRNNNRENIPLRNVNVDNLQGGNEENQGAPAAQNQDAAAAQNQDAAAAQNQDAPAAQNQDAAAAQNQDAVAAQNQDAAAAQNRAAASNENLRLQCFEACYIFLIVIFVIQCADIIAFKHNVWPWGDNVFPKIQFNLDRPRCISEDKNTTFPENCIEKRKAHFLNENVVRSYCRISLKDAFINNCENNGLRTSDKLPIIKYDSFIDKLNETLKKAPIDNATTEDIYEVCVQVFRNNPFGDVEVNGTDQPNFVFRNRALLLDKCSSSPPPNSHPFAELPLLYIYYKRRPSPPPSPGMPIIQPRIYPPLLRPGDEEL
ncbi:uncharacterized protein LOC135832692 isoform X2 [Planococcus citri]|uniref:uncharacterized protein LOC135832692 isoform X2 n=1 Tax=Planococcus citri TaxID=170843 RepID=UPI0031F8EAAE